MRDTICFWSGILVFMGAMGWGCTIGYRNGPTQNISGNPPVNGLATIEDFAYIGAFRLSSETFGASSTNYSIGTLAYNPDHHSLFIAGYDHDRAVAEFPIPELLPGTDLLSLNVANTPLQNFVSLLGSSPNGNPEELDRITGLLYINGQLLINAEQWFDAPGDNRDTTLVVRDAGHLKTSAVDGYFELGGGAHASGYMSAIPAEWHRALGGKYLTGWSSVYSIISRYSIGPTLFVFDPKDILNASSGSEGPIRTVARMNFGCDKGRHLFNNALETRKGGASDLWNFLSRAVYAFIVPGTRTFAVFGSSGYIDSGIGYKITQDNGNECGGGGVLRLFRGRFLQLLLALRSSGDPERPRSL